MNEDNRITFPKKRDPNKKNLPSRTEYLGAISWLKDVQKYLGDSFVFALDDALMCQGSFLGRTDEFLIFGYGDEVASEYNGVVLLGNSIDEADVEYYSNSKMNIKNLRFTNFNKTLNDSIKYEYALDMQGITEALSRYYETHNQSFNGLIVPTEYQEMYEELKDSAMTYYES